MALNEVQKKLMELKSQGQEKPALNPVQQKLMELKSAKKPAEPTFTQDLVGDVKETAGQIGESLTERGEQLKDIVGQAGRGEIGTLRAGLRTLGTGVGAATDIAGGAVMGLGKAILPQKAEESVAEGFQKAMESKPGQVVTGLAALYEKWKEKNPEIAKDIGAVANIASVLPVEKAAVSGLKGLTAVGRGTKAAVEAGEEALGAGVKGTIKAAEKAAEPVAGLSGLAKREFEKVAEFGKQVPERIETAGKAATEMSESLAKAKPSVRKAVAGGIDMPTAVKVAEATTSEKAVFKQMKQAADAFSEGKPVKPPADVAGSYMQKQIKQVDELRKEIGQKQGELTKSLKGKTQGAKLDALAELRKKPGFEDLTIDNKGQLDFSGTKFFTSLTSSERNNIQAIFNDITDDAYKNHLLRQGIFEDLGGKKAAKLKLTGTEEEMMEAIRKGLAESIGKVEPRYMVLNQEYAKLAEPLKGMRKFYRSVEGATEDVLDERSGLLMRRLTSNAVSGQELKMLLKSFDDLMKTYGKGTDIDMTKLQDFMNLLDEAYPEVRKKTALEGQVRLAVGKSDIINKVFETVTKPVQVTPEFTRKLIDGLLE